jgi:hypothetical protein
MRRAALWLLLWGCGDPSGGSTTFGTSPLTSADGHALHMTLFTAPQPPERGQNQSRLVFTDENGAPVEGLTLSVTPWMPEHGHGSAVTPDVQLEDAGTFTVTNLYLPMPGTWQLRIDVSGAVTDELVPAFDIP